MNDTEALAYIHGTKESITVTTALMSSVYDKILYNIREEYDSWHDVLETMNGYQEWNDPPNILEDTSPNYEFSSENIKPDFYIGNRCCFLYSMIYSSCIFQFHVTCACCSVYISSCEETFKMITKN